MKFYLILIIGFIMVLNNCTKKHGEGILRVGIDPTRKPFAYVDTNNQLQGFSVDLSKLIAKHLCMEVEFDKKHFTTLIQELKNGIIDVIPDSVKTKAREKNFDFSNPYRFDSLAILSLNNSPINSKQDFQHKKIAVTINSSLEKWLKANMRNTEIITTDNTMQAITMLQTKRVDGYLAITNNIMDFITNNTDNINHYIIEDSKIDVGFMLKKDNNILLSKINLLLSDKNVQKEIEQLQKKHGIGN